MTKHQRRELIRICLAAGLLLAMWLLPLSVPWRLMAFLVPYALVGWDVLWDAARGLVRGQLLDEKFLMSIATLGAIALGEYPEAVAVMVFYQAGEWFQGMAVGKSRRDIAALMDIRPETATVLRDGGEQTVPPETVAVGETVVVRPGEKIPLDGEIIHGQTTVNAAALTGESLPQDKAAGDAVLGGTVNLSAVIRVRVSSDWAHSTVSRVRQLVEYASVEKSRSVRFITRFSRLYTPIVVGAAAALAVLPPLLLHQSWLDWLSRALIFLVVSCPCALVLSVPVTFLGGISGASRQGVLVKSADHLETLARLKTVVLDKTGTLTRGSFAVSAIHPQGVSDSELLAIAAMAESRSTHPIAKSLAAAHGGPIDESRIEGITERPGLGVTARIDGHQYHVGNDKLMAQAGAACHLCHHTGTLVHIAKGAEYLGHIVISDEVKPDAAEAIAELKRMGVRRTVVLTGDGVQVAQSVGEKLGVDEVQSELLPQDKVAHVERLLHGGSPLAFVGDGINDAPVLARADVGVAMGGMGSDAAIEAADVVLMDDKPSALPKAMRIARKTLRIVRQNIALILLVKAVALALSALGLVGMWAATFADVGVMALAVLNALRAVRA